MAMKHIKPFAVNGRTYLKPSTMVKFYANRGIESILNILAILIATVSIGFFALPSGDTTETSVVEDLELTIKENKMLFLIQLEIEFFREHIFVKREKGHDTGDLEDKLERYERAYALFLKECFTTGDDGMLRERFDGSVGMWQAYRPPFDLIYLN